jgi:hypothetical protein
MRAYARTEAPLDYSVSLSRKAGSRFLALLTALDTARYGVARATRVRVHGLFAS